MKSFETASTKHTNIVLTNIEGPKAQGIHGKQSYKRVKGIVGKPNDKATKRLAERIKSWEEGKDKPTKPGSLKCHGRR